MAEKSEENSEFLRCFELRGFSATDKADAECQGSHLLYEALCMATLPSVTKSGKKSLRILYDKQKSRPEGRRFLKHRREIQPCFLLGLAVTYSPTS